jgi:ribosomal protein S18 acetylase RimI-like enzyme
MEKLSSISNVQIRAANIDDAAAMHRMTMALSAPLLQYPNQQMPPWLELSLSVDEFCNRIISYHYHYFVAVQEGENNDVIGFIAIKMDAQNPTHLYHLFVDERHQSKGVASALWKNVKAQLSIKQCTVRSSKNAVGFYQTLGFEPSDDRALQAMNGVVFQAMMLAAN